MRLSLMEKVEDAHEDAVWTTSWADEVSLITGSVDETVKVWTTSMASERHTLGVISVATDASGTFAASSALDSFIRVWNLTEASTRAVMETPPSETWQICFHPTADSLTIVTAGGSSNCIALWDCDTAEKTQTFQIQEVSSDSRSGEDKTRREKFVLSVACSPDGRYIASGSQDGTLCLFDSASGRLLHLLEGHYKPIRGLAFTPDGCMLLTACDDMHSHLYSTSDGTLIEAFSGHESWILSIDCHPSGHTFATGSSDSKVKLWDLNTRTCAQTLSDHTDQVWDVAFNPSGGKFTSVSDDKAVALYSCNT